VSGTATPEKELLERGASTSAAVQKRKGKPYMEQKARIVEIGSLKIGTE